MNYHWNWGIFFEPNPMGTGTYLDMLLSGRGFLARIFRPIFNASDLTADGRDFDHLFKDGERFKIGALAAEAIARVIHPDAFR